MSPQGREMISAKPEQADRASLDSVSPGQTVGGVRLHNFMD
jgi:hypothetical protein